MSLSWGERAEIKRDAVSEVKGQLVDRENRVESREKEVEKRVWQVGFKEEQLAEKEEWAQQAITQKVTLAKSDVEILEKRVKAKEEDLDATITRLKDAHAAELLVKEAEWKSSLEYRLDDMREKTATALAEAKAKDTIIASKDQEIARLDELLKVTMSKLTQIDVKGLTIHVENTKQSESSK